MSNAAFRTTGPGLALGILMLALAACSTDPPSQTGPDAGSILGPALAPPVRCNVDVNLRITMAEGSGGSQAIRGDDVGNTPYEEGVDGVGAHLSGVNGNLMLSVQQSASRRFTWASTAGSGLSDDRLYTNTHTNPGGNNACGLAGMVPGSSGTAVLEAELSEGNSSAILRYGKPCVSGGAAGALVTTTRSADGNTWTISGTSGVHCDKGSSRKLVQVGTAGPFSMTLVKIN